MAHICFVTANSRYDEAQSTVLGELLHRGLGCLPDAKVQAAERLAGQVTSRSEPWRSLRFAVAPSEDEAVFGQLRRTHLHGAGPFTFESAPHRERFRHGRGLMTALARSDALVLVWDRLSGRTHDYAVQLLRRALGAGVPPHAIVVCLAVNAYTRAELSGDALAAEEANVRAALEAAGVPDAAIVPFKAMGVHAMDDSPQRLLDALPPPERLPEGRAADFRMPVGHTVAGQADAVISGRVAAGQLQVGAQVLLQPLGTVAVASSIHRFGTPVDRAAAGDFVSVELAGVPRAAVDAARRQGLLLTDPAAPQFAAEEFEVAVDWLDADGALFMHSTIVDVGPAHMRARVVRDDSDSRLLRVRPASPVVAVPGAGVVISRMGGASEGEVLCTGRVAGGREGDGRGMVKSARKR